MAKDSGPKPSFKFPMHNTHLNKALSNLRTACVLSLLGPMLFFLFHNAPRKLAYKNFYTTYDPMDAFDRMRAGGYLASVPKETPKEREQREKEQKEKEKMEKKEKEKRDKEKKDKEKKEKKK